LFIITYRSSAITANDDGRDILPCRLKYRLISHITFSPLIQISATHQSGLSI
jgi:hypothetical protein